MDVRPTADQAIPPDDEHSAAQETLAAPSDAGGANRDKSATLLTVAVEPPARPAPDPTVADEPGGRSDRSDPLESTLKDPLDMGAAGSRHVPPCPSGFAVTLGEAEGRTLRDELSGVSARDAGEPPPRKPLPTLAGYEILGELGRGGMGVVYLARHVRLNRLCALKMVLAGEHATPEAIVRFLVEAEMVAQLRHPNIVQVYHVGELGGLPFFELEYVDSGSLAHRINGTPWVPVPAARLVETLALAIEEAHRKRIIHRDLKPANILLMRDGTPRITDFGLAKSLTGDSSLTKSGAIMGSPSYMAPEQAKGQTRQVAPAVDVYSLGAILYELLTGRPPFRAPTILETLQQVMTEEPVPPSRLVSGLPRDVETIALKCLEKEPGRRYETAAALADDLRRFQAGESILARRAGSIERAQRWCRRNPLVAGLAMAFTGSLLAGILGASYFAILANRRAIESARHAGDAQREARSVQEEKRLGDRRVYLAEMNLAQRDWEQGRIDEVLRRLRDQNPGPSRGLDLRGFEWPYLERLCHSELRSLRGHVGEVFGLAVSRDARRIASAGADATVRIREIVTGEELLTLRGHVGPVWSVALSPDDRQVASGGEDGTIRVVDAISGALDRVLRGHTAAVTSVVFSPVAGRLASISRDRTLRIWDLATGQPLKTIPAHFFDAWNVAYSPDGRRIATAGQDETVRLWDADAGTEQHVLRGHVGAVRAVTFSPDGKLVASTGDDQSIRVWDVATGRESLMIRAHEGPGPVRSVAFSPDGRRLASTGGDRTVRLFALDTGREVVNLRGHTNVAWGVAFLPDGRRLASCAEDGTIRIWDLTMDPQALVLRAHANRVRSVAFSPDGRRLATAGEDGTVWIWDSRTGREEFALRGHDGKVMAAVFDRDGKHLFSGGGDGAVRVWDAITGRGVRTLVGHRGEVRSVALSPDGRQVASAGADQTVRLWDAATGRPERVLHGHSQSVACVTFSRDGTRLASSGEDGTVRVWDPLTGVEVAELQAHEGEVYSVAFSPDGRRLASSGQDRAIRVWDAASGELVLRILGHTQDVAAVAFDRDGRRLASASWDSTVRLWDTVTGREALTLHGHREPVSSVTFSPDGRRLASAGFDEIVRIWDASELTPDLTEFREALCVLRSLDRAPAKGDPAGLLRADRTITDDVRRTAIGLLEEGEASRRLRAQQARERGFIQDWLLLAPLALPPGHTGADAIDQEQLPSEPALRPRGGDPVAYEGERLVWTEYRGMDYIIDFNRVVGDEHPLACAYAVCYLEVNAEHRDLGLRIGRDDQAKLYLNGKEIRTWRTPSQLIPDQDAAGPITLKPGSNVLVFKVLNQAGKWAGCVRLVDRSGKPFQDFQVRLTPGP